MDEVNHNSNGCRYMCKEGESRRRSEQHRNGPGGGAGEEPCSGEELQLERVFFLLIIFSSLLFKQKRAGSLCTRRVQIDRTGAKRLRKDTTRKIENLARGGNGMCNMCLPPIASRLVCGRPLVCVLRWLLDPGPRGHSKGKYLPSETVGEKLDGKRKLI